MGRDQTNEQDEVTERPTLHDQYAVEVTAPISAFNAKSRRTAYVDMWSIGPTKQVAENWIAARDRGLWHAKEKAAMEDLSITNEWHLRAAHLERSDYRVVHRVVSQWHPVV